MASVRIESIRKSLDSNPILKGISLEIEDGELVVLVGPSGCGKSTLLRTLAGLETPDSGEIWIGKRRVDGLEPRDRNIAMVFQSYALYPHMNVRANLAFALRLRGVDGAEMDKRVEQVAAMLGIDKLLGRYPRQLSGGQRQRVAMGRALVREADVYLLDEPLSNLDAALRTQTRVEIKKLHSRLGATMIYVTHDQVEAMTLADRLVVLRAGEVMQVGAPATLYDKPDNTFVATFLGSPPMNLLSCQAGSERMEGSGVVLPCPAGVRNRGKVTVGIRPHALQIDGTGGIQAVVDAVEPLGWDANVHCHVGDQLLVARLEADRARQLQDGASLRLGVGPGDIHVFDAETDKALAHGE